MGFFKFTIYPGNERISLISMAFFHKDHFIDELGKEAGRLILDYLFNGKNIFRIFSKVLEEERDYLDYLFSLGFKLEGIQKDQISLEGSYLNLCNLGIFREEANIKSVQPSAISKNLTLLMADR